MRVWRIGLIGFGAVARAWVRLVMARRERIAQQYNAILQVTGIHTARHGTAIDPAGLDLEGALNAYARGDLGSISAVPPPNTTEAFIDTCPADIIVELSVLNPETGQPALDHVRWALDRGRHVVTANKGPLAHAYTELREQARVHRRWLLFESTVMDGIPVFSMLRWGFPSAEIRGFYGILNSTTNLILTRMEQGQTLDQAIREAQAIGIAEADPSNDIDGWDAAVKVCVLANVLMEARLKPSDIQRTGIRHLTSDDLQRARAEGYRIKLVCRAYRESDGTIHATVQPERVPFHDPLAQTKETEAFLCVETDSVAPVALMERSRATPEHTAYGVLADILQIVRMPDHPVYL